MRMRTLIAPVVIALASVAAAAQTNGVPEEFTAVAIANNNLQTGAGTVLISIDRWSSDAERNRLVTTFREKGPDALLDELQDTRPVEGSAHRIPSATTFIRPADSGRRGRAANRDCH